MSKYDRETHLKQLVEYIKEKTSDGKWITITTKDVVAMFDTGGTYAYTLLSDLKYYDEIESTRSINSSTGKADGRKYMFRYKYYTQTETKVSKYKSLTAEQESICERLLKEHGLSINNIPGAIKIVNALVSLGAVNGPVKGYVEKLADLFIMTHNQVRLFIDVIVQSNLAVVKDNYLVVTFGAGNTSNNEVSAIEDDTVDVDNTPAQQVIEQNDQSCALEVAKDTAQESVQNISADPTPAATANLIGNMVIENVSSFIGHMGEFKDFFEASMNEFKSTLYMTQNVEEFNKLKSENEELKKQLDSGNDILSRYLDEESTLKAQLKEKSDDNRVLKSQFNALYTAMSKKTTFMQDRFELAIAEITTLVAKHNSTAAWQLTPEVKAKFQNSIVRAITDAVQEILEFSTADKEIKE